MPRRTLAEELAELATTGPTPDLDPEADAFGEGPALIDSDADEGGAAAAGVPARRLRGDIGDLGAEYAGRRTSTAAALGAAEKGDDLLDGLADRDSDGESSASEEEDVALIGAGEPEDSDSEGGSGASEVGQRGGEESSEDEDDDVAADDADAAVARMMAAAAGGGMGAAAQPDAAAEDGVGVAAQANGAAASSSDDDDMREASPETDGELEALQREFDAVAAADAEAAGGLTAKAEADRRRGVAAGRQRRLWERSLELRIRAQRAVAASHRLPGPEAHAAAAAALQPLASGFAAAAEAAAAAIRELLALQGALLAQNPAIAEAAEAAEAAGDADSRKRLRQDDQNGAAGLSESAAELWRQIEDGTAAWTPYRDASLDRWHRRAALSGGAAAARGGLKALAQPFSAQVATALAAPGRLLARSQLPRAGAPPMLCKPRQPDVTDGAAADSATANGSTDAAAGAASDVDQRLPHTYDDADLYEQLLKEFLEGSGAPGSGAALLQRAPKRRKTVDRRASKGRKLRFHVHDKLVNFMTPAYDGRQSGGGDGVGAALFSNVFGQRQQPAAAAQLA